MQIPVPLHINPEDAARLAIGDGELAICESRTGSIEVTVHIDDTVQPGCLSLPHGFGLNPVDADGKHVASSPVTNLPTNTGHYDLLAKTPHQKNVPVRIRKFTRSDSLA